MRRIRARSGNERGPRGKRQTRTAHTDITDIAVTDAIIAVTDRKGVMT